MPEKRREVRFRLCLFYTDEWKKSFYKDIPANFTPKSFITHYKHENLFDFVVYANVMFCFSKNCLLLKVDIYLI